MSITAILTYFRRIILMSVILMVSTKAMAATTLNFRAPDSGPVPSYVTALLEEAYAELGIKIAYLDMPRARSIVEANAGRIAGELGRLPGLEQDYPNLIRLDFELFRYQLVIIADRRHCGLCELNDLENLAYVNGMHGVEQVLEQEQYQRPTVQALDLEQLLLMYQSQRVKAIVLNDFEAQELGLLKNPHNVAVPLFTESGYHYLHQQHADLVPKLSAILNRLHDEGRVSAIMQATGARISNPFEFSQPPEFGRITATAGHWRRYTNLDGSGAYWELIRRIFGSVSTRLELNSNTYQRAILGLEEQRFDILIGTYAGHQPDNAIVSRLHFDYDRPLFLFAHTEQAINDILQGSFEPLVCHVAGYGYDKFLPAGLNYYHTSNTLDCFAMLDLKRLGAVVAYAENAPDWMNAPYQVHQLHGSLPIHIAFQDTRRGRELRDWFDLRLSALVRSGEIAEFYSVNDLQRSTFIRNLPPNPPQQNLVGARPQN
jgi:ABC-type amino acid transport substrate-binding protein